MGNLTGRMATKGESYAEHDIVEHRQRVATHIDGNTVSYEDSNFTSAEDQSVLNVLSDLGRTAHEGYISNDSLGDMKFECSYDGQTYGGLHTIHGGEVWSLGNMKIAKIRLTWIDNTSYRIQAG